MRKNLAKHTAKKLPLAKRVLALCFALIFVCSCLLPAFANGTGAELETPDTEVVEAADPGAEPEPMDLYDEPAAVADEPAALDDDFAMADEPAAMDDQVEKPVVDDEPAAMDDQVEKPVVDDEPAAMDNEVEKPVEGDEPPVADDTPAKEGATKTTTDASGNTVYEYDTSGTTFPDDDAAALPDGDQMQVDAAFSIPTNIYHFWLKKMSSYDLADIADAAKTAEMTVEQYLAMYGTSEYTLKSLAEEYFATEGFYTYLGSLPDEEQEVLWNKLEPVNQPKDDTAEYEEETQDDGIALLSITGTVRQIHIGKKLVLTSDLSRRYYSAEHSWRSSNPLVATVESGTQYQTDKATVTGVAVGTTTIIHTVKWYYYSYGVRYDDGESSDRYTVTVVDNNTQIDWSDTNNDAAVFVLKTPTSTPESNAPSQWAPDNSECKWIAKVNTYGAEWVQNGKQYNILTYPSQYVTQWPDGTKNSVWTLTENDTDTKYFKEVRSTIFDEYKSSIEKKIKKDHPELANVDLQLKESDVTKIKITPFKISRNNGTNPDKHIDCLIDITSNKVYAAKFWVMEPDATQYTLKDTAAYLNDYDVKETKVTIDSTKTVGSTTYVLKGWYKENSAYAGAADDANAATTELVTTWDYKPSADELADGTVNFYAWYEPVNTDFTVKKEVTGWFGDKTKQFTFAISSDAGTVTVKKDGVAVTDVTNFTLSDGETVKVSGIPANTIITVTEKLDDAGYDTTASGFSQAQTTTERIFRYEFVQEGEKFVLKPVGQYGNGDEVSSNTIVVQNEKEGEIDNGVLLDTLPYILILVVVVGGGVLLFLRKRKNDDDE